MHRITARPSNMDDDTRQAFVALLNSNIEGIETGEVAEITIQTDRETIRLPWDGTGVVSYRSAPRRVEIEYRQQSQTL